MLLCLEFMFLDLEYAGIRMRRKIQWIKEGAWWSWRNRGLFSISEEASSRALVVEVDAPDENVKDIENGRIERVGNQDSNLLWILFWRTDGRVIGKGASAARLLFAGSSLLYETG